MPRFVPAWRKLSGLALFLALGVAAPGAATVSNVRAGQRAGTKLVDIDYDITGTTGWASVSVQVSADGGASYAVPAVAFTGDFGSVPAGRGRRVTWNAAADWNGTYSPAMRFKVTATDAPAGMVLIPAGSFQMGNSTNSAEGNSNELPVHTVNVSAFYMDRYEVTKKMWDDMRSYGLTHGYTDLPVGAGRAPINSVNR